MLVRAESVADFATLSPRQRDGGCYEVAGSPLVRQGGRPRLEPRVCCFYMYVDRHRRDSTNRFTPTKSSHLEDRGSREAARALPEYIVLGMNMCYFCNSR
jgi:hypothetical protein